MAWIAAYQYERQQKSTLQKDIDYLKDNNRLLDRYNKLLIENQPEEKGKWYQPGQLFNTWPGYLT